MLMKFIIGVIRGRTLEKLTHALGDAGVYRLTVSEVELVETGAGPSPGADDRRLRLEIAVNDSFLEPTLNAFRAVRGEDDPVWVSVLPLEEVVRIRTGETGKEAI